METRAANVGSEPPAGKSEGTNARRKKRANEEGDLRYFLPKAGSSPARPELGQEMASEGEALIEAFKNGQQFYALTAWKAVPEVNGRSSPVIVKQALART
jgi:hypothetical protein